MVPCLRAHSSGADCSSTGPNVAAPSALLPHQGLLSRGLQIWPRAAPAWLSMDYSLLWATSTAACTMGSSMAAHGDLLCVVPVGYRGIVCSTVDLSWPARNFCFMPGAPPALLLHRLCRLQGYFSHISHSSFSAAVAHQFFFLLNLLSQRYTECC